jgi:hypothetical protein
MKSKRIGLLNFHYSNNNYGAVLQACAIQDVIKKLGYDVENINFIPSPSQKKLKNYLGDILRFIGLRKSEERQNVKHDEVFSKFRHEYLKESKEYSSSDALHREVLPYSHVVVGSDQVFRPAMTKHNAKVYFLDFCRNSKKIAYAASFGADSWETNQYAKRSEEYAKLLQEFHAVSVREDLGVSICKETFKLEVQHVLDPTLLVGVDYFLKMISEKTSLECDKYQGCIAYYKLDTNERFFQSLGAIAKEKNTVIKNIYHEVSELGYEKYLSVDKWLAIINKSGVVITDSFHCVCLSILMNKDFVCIANKERGVSRLSSLLGSLGLLERLCSDEADIYEVAKGSISWSNVNEQLSLLRVSSMRFLTDSLKD